ncbi:MAG: hypothetical protein J3K34DRAFT_388213 [Monoraphidium minutum]|nr:MAG: hypothetical protein J3K34DRAFT_388213 [Monoraphidium minutum]
MIPGPHARALQRGRLGEAARGAAACSRARAPWPGRGPGRAGPPPAVSFVRAAILALCTHLLGARARPMAAPPRALPLPNDPLWAAARALVRAPRARPKGPP